MTDRILEVRHYRGESRQRVFRRVMLQIRRHQPEWGEVLVGSPAVRRVAWWPPGYMVISRAEFTTYRQLTDDERRADFIERHRLLVPEVSAEERWRHVVRGVGHGVMPPFPDITSMQALLDGGRMFTTPPTTLDGRRPPDSPEEQ